MDNIEDNENEEQPIPGRKAPYRVLRKKDGKTYVEPVNILYVFSTLVISCIFVSPSNTWSFSKCSLYFDSSSFM